MTNPTPVEQVRGYFSRSADCCNRQVAAAAFKEVADLNEWYERRVKWYGEKLYEVQQALDATRNGPP